MTHMYLLFIYYFRFTVAFVSGRQDSPSDETAFSLTSFEA